MNIFAISNSASVCAECLDDKRVNKMLLESAQLLCNAVREHFPSLAKEYEDIIYKETHINHPCSVWVMYNKRNMFWLLNYYEHLHREYRVRKSNKVHATYKKLDPMFCKLYMIMTEDHRLEVTESFDMKEEDFINVTSFKGLPTFEAYKKTLIFKWDSDKLKPFWTKRQKPTFYITEENKDDRGESVAAVSNASV